MEDTITTAKVPANIVYANPCKSPTDLHYAKSCGSPLTVVDSFEEIDKLSEAKYEGGALVRIAVDDETSVVPFSRKFGLAPASVADLATHAYSKGIDLKGVSFHVGSGCKDNSLYERAMMEAASAANTITDAGHYANIIDIGGGFFADARDLQHKAIFIRGAMVNLKIRQPPFTFIAEPGRFFAEAVYDFYVPVIGKKRAMNGEGWHYTIDDSLYGQFSGILFDHARPKWVRVRGPKEAHRPMTAGVLFGRTCDSLDVIAKARRMEELEVGDWLWFPRMGAYTRATASEFNGFPHPAVEINRHKEESYTELFDKLKGSFPDGIQYAEPVKGI